MSVTHHRCPKQFRRCSFPEREHVVESSFDDPERDAAIGRKFNLWGAGCRDTSSPFLGTSPHRSFSLRPTS